MRIISRYRDFYDSIQSLGQDRNLVYLRENKSEECKIKLPIFEGYRVVIPFSPKLEIECYIIGFCGKIYGALKLRKTPDNIERVCYNIDEVDEFVNNNFKEKQIVAYNENKYSSSMRVWSWHHRRERFVEFYKKCDEQKTKHEKLFEEHPIFVKHNKTIEYNAQLKDLEFVRIFDPYQAYQELSMYLGGKAVPQKKMPEISDETMASIKGFDKWSFRKESKK